MVTYFYKENKKIQLTPDKRQSICADINGLFKKYYKDLVPSFNETGDILKELFPDTSDTGKISKIPDLYEQYKTYTSALQQACYPDYRAIVDIEGLDLRSNSLASAYKSSLIYDWYNIDFMDDIDKACNDWAIKGEAGFYICWKREVYQQTTEAETEYLDPLTGETIREKVKIREDVPTFEGIDVKTIDPHNLFFDRSQVDDWDNCKKIYRDFVPLEQILANTSYNLTPDEKKELKELVKNSQKDLSTTVNNKCDEQTKVYGNTIEVLEFEGTYTMPDTLEPLRRMEATVIAGKFLAKFQESDKPKSPYVWDAYMRRPDTGRGQSPLKIPAILNSIQNMCMDLVMKCYTLIANPPFLTPKGAFPRAINVRPGMPIEYDLTQLEQQPRPLDFSNGLAGYNMIDFIRNRAQNATGVNTYMQGSNGGAVRTAAEASYINSGASMRIAREAYLFSHNILYKAIRLFALYKKVFDTVDREVRLDDGTYTTVDEEIRNGNYKFIIGGSQAVVSREAETQKIFQLFGLPVFQSLAQIMDPMAAAELMKWTMNRLNLQGTEQVTDMLDMNQTLRQFAQQQGIQDKNIPEFQEDMRNYIQDNIPQIGQQLINQRINEGQIQQ